MDVSLDGLEKFLLNINNKFHADLSLKGISFDRSNNEFFGLSADPNDFTVFMPSDALKIRNQESAFPSATQKAFKDVVDKGLDRKDNETILIDIASLAPEMQYFRPGGDQQSLIQSLAGRLKDLKNKKVIIRLLVGDEKIQANKDVEDKRWDKPDDYEGSLKKRYEELFWATDFQHEPKASPKYAPIFDHPDVTLYVGYYCPSFSSERNDENIKDVKVFLNKVIKNSLNTGAGTILKFFANLNVDELVDKVVVNQAPSITWNHGKVLAVNGLTAMTGGINYWDLYAHNGPHDICDHSVKVTGDAAVSAHRWADYFWNYLGNLQPKGTDKSSFWRKADLSKPPAWTREGAIPDSLAFKKRVTERKLETLTVARLGDWYGAMQPIRYPVQVIDAIRDIVLNIAWQYILPTGGLFHLADKSFMALAGYPFNGYLSDDYLSSNDVKYFQGLGINPIAWASRSARTQVITSATHSVVICQQMLVNWLQNDNEAYSSVVKGLNKEYLTGQSAWTGSVWSFDLLIALAHALTNFSRNKTPDPHPGSQDFFKDSKGIYIVLTTNNVHGNHGGWDDRTTIWEFKKRLRIIMNILPFEYGGVDYHKIDNLVDNYVHFKRSGTSDDPAGHDLYSHSKIVCVDGKLMYVGSDNAYPSYNEEHGIWFEDPAQINAWLEGFFVDYWKACKTPNDLVEPQKPKA